MNSSRKIHLVGAQKSNYPWGFENRLIPAFESLGCSVISTDFRQDKNTLADRLAEKADLVLVCKGEWIQPQIISSCPYVTALWYAEQIGDKEHCDEVAFKRREELSFNVKAFDYVFSHDQGNLDLYRDLGAQRVAWLPCAAVDPAVNKKNKTAKRHDVSFIGSRTPRRKKIISEIERMGIKVFWPDIWDPAEMNRCFNESKIVLNIHLSDMLNTETRIAEVLGSGSFLISEQISSPGFIEDRKHFVSFVQGNTDELADLIRYYLSHEEEREKIAFQGYNYIHENHTYKRRMEDFLNSLDFGITRRIWPSYSLGFLFDSKGKITLRMDAFYDAILDSFEKNNPINEAANINFTHSQVPQKNFLRGSENNRSSGSENKCNSITQQNFREVEVSCDPATLAKNKNTFKDNNLDKAFEFADSLIAHSAWSISKKALKLIIEEIGHDITGILEFGAGYSTIFFAKWMAIHNKYIPIHSFEHNATFGDQLSKDLQSFPYVKLHKPKLKQLSDYEYGKLFLSDMPSTIYRDMGNDVPLEFYHYTRLHNVFYDIELDKFNLSDINLIIIDGPNGNGRSIAFPLLRDIVKLPVYCLVDDFTHYPFLQEMRKCFVFSKIFEFDYGHDAYSFMKITEIK